MPATYDYSELDDALVAAIASGISTFSDLSFKQQVKNAARSLEQASPRDRRGECKPAWRFIDGRLQALRKRGVLRHDRTHGWNLGPNGRTE